MQYDMAIIVTVNVNTYEEACVHTEEIAEGLNSEGLNASAVFDYDHDSDGQRVLYLPAEELAKPSDKCPDCGRPIALQSSGWWTHDGLPNDCWHHSMDGPNENV